ncbi:hypothetical protein CCM_06134 [Cordyceps militaris CM01]|uniref:Uncharacterized protein n=1 Tax=Cordyceps militaris (strain CM01) TaxID=983644 RepID=G3JIY0_CORMM|nr:uncharacterized protein CCM_06134 [Cordyceps militaris CM01]EGX91974.1 hypothetical protein CCM_06134 [Cordyceps militaris CM01]
MAAPQLHNRSPSPASTLFVVSKHPSSPLPTSPLPLHIYPFPISLRETIQNGLHMPRRHAAFAPGPAMLLTSHPLHQTSASAACP